MADPHHVEALDRFDRTTVGLYRLGVALGAIGTASLAAALLVAPDQVAVARLVVLAAAALIVANLHLYARTIRWAISAAGWTGAVSVAAAAVAPTAAAPWLADAGLGFVFVVFSAVALKERFCFRLPVVVAVPPLLAGALIPLRLGLPAVAGGLLGLAAAVLALLALAKLGMPLHYDIGDKERYEV